MPQQSALRNSSVDPLKAGNPSLINQTTNTIQPRGSTPQISNTIQPRGTTPPNFQSNRNSLRPVTPNTQRSIFNGSIPQQNTQNYKPQQKIDPNFIFNWKNCPVVQCHYHNGENICNFDKNPTQLMPLCPTCVKIHDQQSKVFGTFTDIDTLPDALTTAYQGIANDANNLLEDLQELRQYRGDVQNWDSIQKNKLSNIKKHIYSVIDDYFAKLEKDLAQTNNVKKNELLKQIDDIERTVSKQWNNNLRILEKLNSDKCLKVLIKYHQKDNGINSQLLCQQVHQFINNNNMLADLFVDDNRIHQIANEISSIVAIKQPALVFAQPFPLQVIDPNLFARSSSTHKQSYASTQGYGSKVIF